MALASPSVRGDRRRQSYSAKLERLRCRATSASPLKADIPPPHVDIGFVPIADISARLSGQGVVAAEYMCEGYARFRIPVCLRELVRRSSPEERPNYWVPDSYDVEGELSAALRNSAGIETDSGSGPRRFRAFGNPGDGAADLGFPTRRGGGRVSATRNGLPRQQVTTVPTNGRRPATM